MTSLYEKFLEYVFGPSTDENRFSIIKEFIFGVALLFFLILLTPEYPLIGLAFLVVMLFSLIFIDSIDAILIVKFIDFIAFCIANYVVFLIFEHFFSIEQKWFYILLFILSVIIVKIEWILILIRKISTMSASQNIGFPKINVSKGIFITVIPVAIKQLFFNSVYAIFPVFLVWLGFSIIAFLTNSIAIPSIDSQNVTEPFAIITAISISLGIFQYYLKRQEEKVFARIDHILRQMDAIINEETSFDVFYSRVKNSEEPESFTKWIINQTDPRAFAFELLPRFLEIPRLRRLYSNILNKMQVPLIQLSINYADSSKKFKAIEDSSLLSEHTGHQDRLYKIYDGFFGEERDSEIIEKIRKNIDIFEFGMLTLSNINIVQEILPGFINLKSRQEFEKILNKEISQEKCEDLSSFKRREIMRSRIYQKLLSEIMR